MAYMAAWFLFSPNSLYSSRLRSTVRIVIFNITGAKFDPNTEGKLDRPVVLMLEINLSSKPCVYIFDSIISEEWGLASMNMLWDV